MFSHRFGKVRHMFIKREIPHKINGQTYYDCVTAYGYGGPVICECLPDKRKELVREFYKAFALHCSKEKIVSEFIRFHPVINNAEDFKEVYDVHYMRVTVGTNLKDYEDPVASEFTSVTRRNVRRALKKGVEYRVLERPADLEAFKEIYYKTMERKQVDDYYFFNDDYFKSLLQCFRDNLLVTEASYQGRVIAMMLSFRYNNLLHTHLSGSYEEYHHLYPVYMMQYGITLWGKEHGYHLLHGGGGRTNNPEDTLYGFKKQFGMHTAFQFYIGKKIWLQDIYLQLCEMENVDSHIEFFPAYRSKSVLIHKTET